MEDFVPFCLLKKVANIRELNYTYSITEDGYGSAEIDGALIEFFVNEYGEIELESAKLVGIVQ